MGSTTWGENGLEGNIQCSGTAGKAQEKGLGEKKVQRKKIKGKKRPRKKKKK